MIRLKADPCQLGSLVVRNSTPADTASRQLEVSILWHDSKREGRIPFVWLAIPPTQDEKWFGTARVSSQM